MSIPAQGREPIPARMEGGVSGGGAVGIQFLPGPCDRLELYAAGFRVGKRAGVAQPVDEIVRGGVMAQDHRVTGAWTAEPASAREHAEHADGGGLVLSVE